MEDSLGKERKFRCLKRRRTKALQVVGTGHAVSFHEKENLAPGGSSREGEGRTH